MKRYVWFFKSRNFLIGKIFKIIEIKFKKEVNIEVVSGSFNELNVDGQNIIYQNVSALGYSGGK